MHIHSILYFDRSHLSITHTAAGVFNLIQFGTFHRLRDGLLQMVATKVWPRQGLKVFFKGQPTTRQFGDIDNALQSNSKII
jgi:hypothetical protein